MSIEVSPVGVICNLSCPYCYEHPMRDAGNFTNGKEYDLDKMIQSLEKEKHSFSLFGGEPLLTDINTLEKLWEYGYNRFSTNGIQTNGTLITQKHIELFKKYNVHVGISLDGPDELNDARWAGSLSETRRRTGLTLEAIDNLIKNNHIPSLIITLHKLNATKEKLPRLKSWLKELDNKGLQAARLHVLEVEYSSVSESFSLTPQRNKEVMLEMAQFESECKNLRFDVFKDIKNMLLAEDNEVTCTFHECDPYTTSAVQGIDGQGIKSNCGRTNKDGVNFIKSDTYGYERQLALYHTPQEYGGCKDCRFFIMCKGQCPGTGENSDWRNKTDLCEMYFDLFEHFEKKYEEAGVLPLSRSPELKRIENIMMNMWSKQSRTGIQNNIFPILSSAQTIYS